MRKFFAAAILALACVAPSFAAECSLDTSKSYGPGVPIVVKEENPFKVGLIGGFQLPTGSLKNDEANGTNSNMGWNAGIQASFDFTKNSQIRGSLMYGMMPGQKSTTTLYDLGTYGDIPLAITADRKASYQTMTAGLDYVYSFDSSNSGLYVLGGVGLTNLKATYTDKLGIDGYNIATRSSSVNETGLTYKAGVGYHFNEHASLEATYNYMPVSSSVFGFDNASSLGVSLLVSF